MEILAFCHLRWDFVYQRPQHLLTRFSSLDVVHLWEEPKFEDLEEPKLEIATPSKAPGVKVITPILPHGAPRSAILNAQRRLLDAYIREHGMEDFVAWYYTPMALEYSDHLTPAVTVYDCMDELSAFQGAPPELREQEERLFKKADVVFAGGASIFAAKRRQHGNVHLFPSSIDYSHFATARDWQEDAADQVKIPHPRVGFYGVLDERLDRELLWHVAALQPEWHFVLIGPVVKIREEDLPVAPNLHYLGKKSYAELPRYLANWDVAMLPFALNAATQFISPTKTPEYLAGGKPVISTPIKDVVKPYGELGLVKIVSDAAEFADGLNAALHQKSDRGWLGRVDRFLEDMSWDKTFDAMREEIQRMTPHGSGRSVQFTEEFIGD